MGEILRQLKKNLPKRECIITLRLTTKVQRGRISRLWKAFCIKDFAEKEGLCLVYILDLRTNLKLFARYHSSFASYAHVLEVFAIPTRKGRKKKPHYCFIQPRNIRVRLESCDHKGRHVNSIDSVTYGSPFFFWTFLPFHVINTTALAQHSFFCLVLFFFFA